ncbi:hypothetical protein GQ43DRAFT_214744 [Delitschia confertaspora ATCC 74209]|uniref:Uncharacterized protein n=1 Tax=Delitschia confertaspora ATCC 74209 TaxID=1513339 RepID=A0A9P4JRH6_9PLEO|nr:hypothetical protein GQ43DRAFT_214744 [Delitschia confertaspora ATCC 74209]
MGAPTGNFGHLPTNVTAQSQPSIDASKSASLKGASHSADSKVAATEQQTAAAMPRGGEAPGTRQKSQAEQEADRLYEERMEEEYAKREGGA